MKSGSWNGRSPAERFGRAAHYDERASVQAAMAVMVAQQLAMRTNDNGLRILDLGAGTGLVTRTVAEFKRVNYARAVDASAPMLAQCSEAFLRANIPHTTVIADLDSDDLDAALGEDLFDVVAMAFVVPWLKAPEHVLARAFKRVHPAGTMMVTTLGPETFAPWRAIAREHGASGELPFETRSLDGWETFFASIGACCEARSMRVPSPGSTALACLQSLRAIGATAVRRGTPTMPPHALAAALRDLDARGSDPGDAFAYDVQLLSVTAARLHE
jgi:malonyl-CoA O-methyltransferase